MIMGLPEFNDHYTVSDLLKADEIERAELIDGVLYDMSPTPLPKHQLISNAICAQLWSFLEGKPCEVYPAPFDVYPLADNDDSADDADTMVEPDITVVCDPSKVDDHGCKGAPDFVVEILSPSNFRHDRLVKYNLYMRAKVREYWIVDPQEKTVEVYLLDENGYLKLSEIYGENDTAKITVLNDCPIDLKRVF